MQLFQVDAFTDQVFGGNPAAVCIVEEEMPEDKMQLISMENNLSETAFLFLESDGVHIRWFTPEMEIDLCGHATLASAHVLFHHLGYSKRMIRFRYGGGELFVRKEGSLLCMDFPAIERKKTAVGDSITNALGATPAEVYQARDLMAVFRSEKEIHDLRPDFAKMMALEHLGVIATAPGDNVDFVSRFFAPVAGINEDPVTGSAHCMLIPYWADRLRKNDLEARQLSKRGGRIYGKNLGDRVEIAGKSITYMIGEVTV